MVSRRGPRVLVGTAGGLTVKAAVAVAAATAIVLWVAGSVVAQAPSSPPGHAEAQAPAPRPGQPPARPAPGGGMSGHGVGPGGMMPGGMMGGLPMMGGPGGTMGGSMMCPMMGMMGGGMPGAMPMMGGVQDPKTLARMLQLHGEVMRAVGEVLLKHAKTLEGSGG